MSLQETAFFARCWTRINRKMQNHVVPAIKISLRACYNPLSTNKEVCRETLQIDITAFSVERFKNKGRFLIGWAAAMTTLILAKGNAGCWLVEEGEGRLYVSEWTFRCFGCRMRNLYLVIRFNVLSRFGLFHWNYDPGFYFESSHKIFLINKISYKDV